MATILFRLALALLTTLSLIPLIFLLLVSAIAPFYLAYKKMYDVDYGAGLIMIIFISCYVYGDYLKCFFKFKLTLNNSLLFNQKYFNLYNILIKQIYTYYTDKIIIY